MSISTALVKLLKASPLVLAALGDGGNSIYPLQIPQQPKLPAVAYQLVGYSPSYSLSGNSQLASAQLQLSLFGDSYDAVEGLHEKIRKALELFRGTIGGVDVQMVKELTAIDILEEEPHEKRVYHRAVDIEITYLINAEREQTNG